MNEPLTYKSAGVDIDEANAAVMRMKESVRSTFTSNVLSDIGAFGGLFKAVFSDYADPILVSSIDGVGSKTKIAAMMGKYDTVGFDIVNHCVNDILVQGAKPLFFLDYFGAGSMDSRIVADVVAGVASACKSVDCALIGGETAQMPDTYNGDDFDLVGAIVGVVERDKILPREEIRPADAIIGLASSGLHTNGYTLARKALFDVAGYRCDSYVEELDGPVGAALLEPHRCYADCILPLLNDGLILAMAHITGGGFFDNIPRVTPSDCQAIIDRRSWEVPTIFRLIQRHGQIAENEMYRTFNMGIGMVLICRRDEAPVVLERLNVNGPIAALIGEITRGAHDVQIM